MQEFKTDSGFLDPPDSPSVKHLSVKYRESLYHNQNSKFIHKILTPRVKEAATICTVRYLNELSLMTRNTGFI